jgi:hypothetical protein
MYHYLAFQPFDKRGGFAYNTVNGWEDVTKGALDVLQPAIDSLRDERLRLQEHEFIEKMMVCWRDKGRGNLVQKEELIVRNKDQAAWLTPGLKQIGLEYSAAIESMPGERARWLYDSNKVPIKRGKGAPYWLPGTDKQAAVMLARISESAKDLAELDKILVEAGSALLDPCITTYIRVQAARKATMDYQVVGGWLREWEERVKPKIRKIQALPFSYNYPVVGVAGVMRHLLKTIGGVTGTIERAQEASRTHKYCMAADLSGYDDTVSLETLTAYREYVLLPCLNACVRKGLINGQRRRLILDIDEKVQQIDALTPPPSEREGARLVPTAGGIKSGERLTSQKGSDINRVRILTKMRDLGIRGASMNFGDDTIVCSDDKNMVSKWFSENFNNHGFIETLADDVSFLMKRIPEGYAYIGRMALSTINREPQKESYNVLGAAAAVQIRHDLLDGHPLQHLYRPAMRAVDGPLRYATRLSEVASLEELLAGMVATLPKGQVGRVDDAQEHIERAVDLRLIGRARARTLIRAISEIAGRTELTYAELKGLARETPLKSALSYIRKSSYTNVFDTHPRVKVFGTHTGSQAA